MILAQSKLYDGKLSKFYFCLILTKKNSTLTVSALAQPRNFFRRGVSPEVIKRLGRWKGNTFQIYVRPDAETCAIWARAILSKPIIDDLDDITFLFQDEWRTDQQY